MATGRIAPDVLGQVIEGVARGCRENGTALLGGETAEMPGFYAEGEYDVAGTIVGVVERSKILDGSRIAAGDLALGLPSAGLHTNGYSLARRVFFEELGRKPSDPIRKGSKVSIADALLAPHLSYLRALEPLLEQNLVHGMAHITGGGFYDNIPRVLPEGLDVTLRAGRLARSGGLRDHRAGRRGLLRGDAPRLQHGRRDGGLRRSRRTFLARRLRRGRTRGRGSTRSGTSKRAAANASSSSRWLPALAADS